ncbi:MAG TPA: RtcB family protein [Xanthomonadales bacterium]
MDTTLFERTSETTWMIRATGRMRVPAIIHAGESLIRDMDDKVREQLVNVTTLPGIVRAAYAMPDAHWGYGFPIGGVAAFDPVQGGVISAGGVGFDISCGVRTHLTGLERADIERVRTKIADALFRHIPVGIGSTGKIHLDNRQMSEMLKGGAAWALEQGFGVQRDLEFIEEGGRVAGARPETVSEKARTRQASEMGTLGSGNHYLEIQEITAIHDEGAARAFGLKLGQCVLTIHCGSRGLGHQIGTEFLREMAIAAPAHGITLPDRELACAPIDSDLGQRYIGAMRSAINCALANRQIVGHLAREVFRRFWSGIELPLMFDVSHNTCKVEKHELEGRSLEVYVHRKGATRSLGPGHPSLPDTYRLSGQPVLIGGSMGTESWVLAGLPSSEAKAFSSACHGAGRSMSRTRARKTWHGRQLIDELAGRGVTIRSPSHRGVAEEAPGAYKDVTEVVAAAEQAGLAKRVARLVPVVCIKG